MEWGGFGESSEQLHGAQENWHVEDRADLGKGIKGGLFRSWGCVGGILSLLSEPREGEGIIPLCKGDGRGACVIFTATHPAAD